MATTAPARRVAGQVVTQTNTITLSASTDVKQGDLVVVVWATTAASSTQPTCTITNGSGGATVASLTDATYLQDGSKEVAIFTGVATMSPTVAPVVTVSGTTGTGTRRLYVESVIPYTSGGSGTIQIWGPTYRTAGRGATGSPTSGSNPWVLGWGGSASSANPEWAVLAVEAGTTNTYTCNPGDGTSRSMVYPTSGSQNFGVLTVGFSTNALQTAAQSSWTGGPGASKVVAQWLFVVDFPQARGNNASQAKGRFTVIRTKQGRGNAAANAKGAGYKYVTTKTAQGRGRAASSASANKHLPIVTGVARTAGDSIGAPFHTVVRQGRGNTAAKATGKPRQFKSAIGPARAAGIARAGFTVIRRAVGAARIAGAGTGRGALIRRATGRAWAAVLAAARLVKFVELPTDVADNTGTVLADSGLTTTRNVDAAYVTRTVLVDVAGLATESLDADPVVTGTILVDSGYSDTTITDSGRTVTAVWGLE